MSGMEATAASRARLPQLTKYDVVEEIGHGGMATVYRARDRRLGREVAVKVIHPHLRDSREVVSRFNTEAKAVAKLRHANIVEVYDVSEVDEAEQYLVVELLRGTTLRKLLQDRGAMPAEVAGAFAAELLSAIAHANASGVIHRDIKPENVLIELRGAEGRPDERPSGEDRVLVKLTDFGIAKLLDAQGVTSTGQVLGSPAHMAPEQIEGGDVDARSDVFGMGVLLYECMVGHLPFEGNNPAQVLRRVLDGIYPSAQLERPSIGSRWSALLDRALAHAPADRFADAGEMRDAVLAELARLGVEAPRRELERWLEDGDGAAGYAARQAKAMVDKLVALGGAARKGGDAIGAAADYNRALALAPDDAQLLRIVAGMNRAEARARVLRQGGVALVIMLGVGTVAFGVGKVLRAREPAPIAADTAAPKPVFPLDPAPSAPPVPEPSATARPAPTLLMRVSPLAPPPSASAKVVDRTIRLDLTPSMGVRVGVDGPPSRDVATGDTVTLDGKAHSLSFGCPVCVPVQRDVPVGDKDDTVVVRLSIKPATLEIVGDGNMTYQIVEHPEVAVRAGGNSVALGSEFERVTVKQIETQTTVPVRLHAGHSVQAGF
jgi:tRNA A-37 threonylcarbamoyl transferase component Bud32